MTCTLNFESCSRVAFYRILSVFIPSSILGNSILTIIPKLTRWPRNKSRSVNVHCSHLQLLSSASLLLPDRRMLILWPLDWPQLQP
ncbi:hypothetical protein BYT27DRAFT_6416455 [Phlegmacium glaucopus]|nr:hypothetical protein BYT27DRAFT_6416455 [Phlegmacium glaucopus]